MNGLGFSNMQFRIAVALASALQVAYADPHVHQRRDAFFGRFHLPAGRGEQGREQGRDATHL